MIMTVVLDFYIIHYLTNNLHQTKPLRTKNIINIITHQELTMGQHVEFRKEILQTMQVGLRLTWKLTKSQLTIMCKLGWAPTWRISKRNSTDNASWAGVPTWKLTKSQLPISVEYKNTH